MGGTGRKCAHIYFALLSPGLYNTQMEQTNNRLITLPGAIIIAAAIIGIAIIWTQKPAAQPSAGTTNDLPKATANIAPITAKDHILGNPEAPIKFVEYSDPSCPFCKTFNMTMEQIMAEYGAGGKVAWVYRHFPLYKPDASGRVLHANAGTQAEAFECAAALGGNNVFWAYEKKWYNVFPEEGAGRSASEDMKQIMSVAESVGLDAVSFGECLSSGRFKDTIDQAYTAGINSGVSGTPYIVIITPSGSKLTRVGDQSYATLKMIVDTLLSDQ